MHVGEKGERLGNWNGEREGKGKEGKGKGERRGKEGIINRRQTV